MNKQAIFSHFSSIIDRMIENSSFFAVYFQSCYVLEETITGSYNDKAIPENINIHFGATRGCIVDSNYDYVVKFDAAEDGLGSVCDRECDIYSRAKIKGLEQYFCEPVFLGYYKKVLLFYDSNDVEEYIDWYDYKNFSEKNFSLYKEKLGEPIPITFSIPLYAYPKASSYSFVNIDKNEEQLSMKIIDKTHSPMSERNMAVAINFIHDYGVQAYYALSDFMIEEYINDLHGGNIGSINDKIVFIDYGGYHTGYYSS